MKVLGIIAEYNPFHNGHAYQIQKAKELTGADYTVVAMSGDFVQRGEPAVYDKYTRTRFALSCGADLVLELPPLWAAASAEDFASGAVALLNAAGIVDILCFGSESGQLADQMSVADVLIREPENYRLALKKELKNGRSFPQARAAALRAVCPDLTIPESPNDILGLEYCKAILRRRSRLTPIPLQRAGSGYHDKNMPDGNFASATALRHMLLEHAGSSQPPVAIQNAVPAAVWELMQDAVPVFPDNLSALLNYRLLQLSCDGTPLTDFADVSEELGARIRRQLFPPLSFCERIEALKSRQYTYTRISRALLHILLDIRTEQMAYRREHGYIFYARILGFRKDSGELMKSFKQSCTVPVITKTADAPGLLSGDALSMFERDILCSHIYQALRYEVRNTGAKNEYQSSPVIL